MNILGLTSFIHHSSAALLMDGEIVAAADEERFTREKFTGEFPQHAIQFCLDRAGISQGQLEHVAFYWNPWRGIVPRLAMMASCLPGSLGFFKSPNSSTPAIRGDFRSWWRMVQVGPILRRAFLPEKSAFKRHFVDHHLAHAASAFYSSPWEESLILSLDGTGEWTTTLMARGLGKTIVPLQEVGYPHSLGVLYGAITQFLGYRTYEDEWKVMGLAAQGVPRYAPKVRQLIRCLEGKIELDLRYFHFQYADKGLWYGPRFIELFGASRQPGEEIATQRFADLAASFQLVTEEIGLGLVRHLLSKGKGCRRLCLAGGVALNAVLNGKILTETGVEELFIAPAAADNGAALGAALYVHHQILDGKRIAPLQDVYWGPDYNPEEIRAAINKASIGYQQPADLFEEVARLLAQGKVVGWFQGRMEYGPRALGNRSILADPRRAEMKGIVNAKVKFREAFRPFAPSILAEQTGEYFERAGRYPFMTLTLPVRPSKRSIIPAVTHLDGTARLQTVEQFVNPRFHKLLSAFYQETGVPVLLNTSLNLQGEPIVCSPEEALSTYLRSGLDALVLGDTLCVKSIS